MTNEEIMQALRCRARHEKATNEGCKKCPYWATENLKEWQKLCGWASCEVYQIISDAADAIERLTAENAALREKQRWIPVTERMPEERVLVNVLWVNRAPEPYYEKIKDVPFSGTACFYRGNWYWDSPVVLDLLAEYGNDNFDLVDDAVEITHWMPLPGAPEEGGKTDA